MHDVQEDAEMLVSRRGFLAAGLAGLGLSAAGGHSETHRVKTLESALGDVVRVEIEPRFEAGAEDVVLCLANHGAAGLKGFDIRRGAAPRFFALPDAAACARVAPARHELFLWKDTDDGFRPVISTHLDLSQAAGGRALITW